MRQLLQTGVSSSARCSKEPTAAIGWLAVVQCRWGEDGSTERGARSKRFEVKLVEGGVPQTLFLVSVQKTSKKFDC